MKKSKAFVPILVLLFLAVQTAVTLADVTVTAPDLNLSLGETTTLTILVSNTAGDTASAIEVYAGIDGGGTDNSAPIFTDVTFTGSVFDPPFFPATEGPGLIVDNGALVEGAQTITMAPVVLDGTLVTFTVNAGTTPGEYAYRIMQVDFTPVGGTSGWDTVIDGGTGYTIDGSTSVGGTITVVPEPASMALFGLLGAACLLRRRRR